MMVPNRRFVIVLLVIVFVVGWASMCHVPEPEAITHPNGKAFAGSASCMECHRDIASSHQSTAHFATSRLADTVSVAGNFQQGFNRFRIDDTLEALMQRTDTGLYQIKLSHGREEFRRRMDLVIGSGRRGQTYLYWMGDRLFQLPISFYAPNGAWCNSPGYPSDRLLFNREVPGGCMECHGTYLKSETDILQHTHYDRSAMILGIECERCHGPAADHVAYQRLHPNDTLANFIINPAKLSRQAQLDNCALCHSGVRTRQTSSFAYVVGDKLDDYEAPAAVGDSASPLDVHGNQYGLLRASKCFRLSKSMTCSSCHDAHRKEADDLLAFSQKCMSCHQGHTAPYCSRIGPTLTGKKVNCIDCHMPSMASKKIFVSLAANTNPVPAEIRTHLIARYSDAKLAQIKAMITNFKK